MADAGTPLIRAEERNLGSPSAGSAHNSPHDFPEGGGGAQGGYRSPDHLARQNDPANAPALRLHPEPLSPPERERARVELSSVAPYQASDRLSLSSRPSSASNAGGSIGGGVGGGGGDRGRQGRRRSSLSQIESARALLAGLLPPGDDRAFVALDIEERKEMLQQRWRSAVPEDVLVHSFSFLSPGDLATVSQVSRVWSHAAYEPSLWTHMDLSLLYTRVDDAFIIHLLGSQRFVNLQFLSLEGCSAITNKSVRAIMHYCPNLRELRLTECSHINNPWIFPELVKSLPFLRRLELFAVTKEFGIVPPILSERPKIDLGLFWLEYCAENGVKTDGTGLAECRYQEGGALADDGAAVAPRAAAGGAGQRGCWGRVKGRIVYGSHFYHRGGNYPSSVLYSCENHHQQDFADPAFHRCQVCENIFASPHRHSMWTEMICKVCFDKENLHNKKNWIPLDAASVRDFSVGDIVSKTIHVASRKNLPVSLRSFGSTPVRLDYTLPEPSEQELEEEAEEQAQERQRLLIPRLGHAGGLQVDQRSLEAEVKAQVAQARSRRIDPTDVPLSTFVAINGWRLDESVHRIKTQLKTATDGLNTRALLVYDTAQNIEVLADKRVILDGREGEEHMQLTVQAWHSALEILYPLVIVMVLSLHFSVLFAKQAITTYNGKTNYSAFIAKPSSGGLGALVIVIIAVGVVVGLVITVALIYRFRDQCERCFKRFLVADILLILMFGAAVILWLLVSQWRIYLDTLTFCILIWNSSVTGLLTLYYPMPERLHHFFLVLLNAIMAIMLIATLPLWIVLVFLFLAALGDIVSELRPNMRLLSPFIIPANVELIYTTPKILYTIGGLRLRAADLLWYGLLTGLAISSASRASDYASVLLGGALVIVCVMASMSLLLFVAPFVGKRVRPLPLAIISAFILCMIQGPVIEPYVASQNNLYENPISF